MIEIVRDKSLKNLNTFGIEARSAIYAEFGSADDLREIFSYPEVVGKPWYVLSGGSNILLTGDFDGLLLHPVSGKTDVLERKGQDVILKADAGVEWEDFVAQCVAEGYWGVENLAGIPGFAGSAPIQNIGAYGREAKDVIESVEYYDSAAGQTVTLSAAECAFGYRDSIFKRELKGRAIILSVVFRLSLIANPMLDYGDLRTETERLGGATLENISRAVVAIRNRKLPDPKVIGNSGSFFKNPVVSAERAEELKRKFSDMPSYPAKDGVKLAAGWLIDRAGWKGYREGDAGVHERQALVLVNYGRANGCDILSLADKIRKDVAAKFGVDIEMEVNIL